MVCSLPLLLAFPAPTSLCPFYYYTVPISRCCYQKVRDATRCELERLLTTAGTDDKKKKVILALDHLEVYYYSAYTCTVITVRVVMLLLLL